jgi:uncharacterized membrane protein
MTMSERSTVVGVFDTRAKAEQAIDELRNAGISDNQIGYIVRDNRDTTDTVANQAGTTAAGNVANTALSGGVVGGVLGAAAALLIPGFGPAIAGGILAATLGGAAIGAAAGGLIGALTNMGVPEEEARYYQSEFEAGRTIVTVQAPGRQREVWLILQSNGAYDMSTRPGTAASTYANPGRYHPNGPSGMYDPNVQHPTTNDPTTGAGSNDPTNPNIGPDNPYPNRQQPATNDPTYTGAGGYDPTNPNNRPINPNAGPNDPRMRGNSVDDNLTA